jgi:antibiotic biosynthesis monooxygenase (ABM) superfamily enzyme
MIERHITFNVHPDSVTEFVRFFADEYRPAAAKSPGLIHLSLIREAEHATRYQMVFRWDDGDSAVRWRTSPEHEALQPGLNALHSGMEIVAYQVVG